MLVEANGVVTALDLVFVLGFRITTYAPFLSYFALPKRTCSPCFFWRLSSPFALVIEAPLPPLPNT